MPDPAVKIEVLAAVTGVSHGTMSRMLARGQLPAPDFRAPRHAVGWRLTTIRRWNPVLANKIERGLADEIFPFAPAA